VPWATSKKLQCRGIERLTHVVMMMMMMMPMLFSDAAVMPPGMPKSHLRRRCKMRETKKCKKGTPAHDV